MEPCCQVSQGWGKEKSDNASELLPFLSTTFYPFSGSHDCEVGLPALHLPQTSQSWFPSSTSHRALLLKQPLSHPLWVCPPFFPPSHPSFHKQNAILAGSPFIWITTMFLLPCEIKVAYDTVYTAYSCFLTSTSVLNPMSYQPLISLMADISIINTVLL